MNTDAAPAKEGAGKPARKVSASRAAKAATTKASTSKASTSKAPAAKAEVTKSVAQSAKPAARKTTRKVATSAHTISPEQRQRMIEECAYFRAQSRGFVPGDAQRDWLEAEAQIDAQLALLSQTGKAQHA